MAEVRLCPVSLSKKTHGWMAPLWGASRGSQFKPQGGSHGLLSGSDSILPTEL